MNLKHESLSLLYAQAPWEDRLAESLQPLAFQDAKKAWGILLQLARPLDFPGLFPGFFPAFLQELSRSYDADLALSNFERFAAKIFDQNYFYTLLEKSPDLLHALVTLFSGSQVLTDTLLKDPGHFDWLKKPEVLNQTRSKDSLMRDFYELAGGETSGAGVSTHLRRFKKREYIRIGLRDLLGKAPMRETVRDISNLADVCLQIAYEQADKECREKYGVPVYQDPEGNWLESEFTILGMGKLGGQELNFSSDIDLIYIYTSSLGETRPEPGKEEGIRISNHEYFTKLSQQLTRTLNEITPEGNVFRVDLDLRPEGKSGEIANSLASCEVYYQSWGRTWERQAMLKARVCAGSIALGNEFFKLMEPFIYRRTLDFSAIEEIKAMKQKINASLKGKKTGKGDIKLGFGGIREIEFIVQAYQLLFGGRQPGLRVKNTLALLAKLREAKYLYDQDHDDLKAAYIFLRNLENRVQISFGLQTHVLPKDDAKLAVLARKMGLSDGTAHELGQKLLQQFQDHTQRVGRMFANLFADKEKREAEQKADADPTADARLELTEKLLAGRGFSDSGQALRFLKALRDGPEFSHPSEKSIQDFYACLPQILDHCQRIPKPNAAVENLVKFLEASRARDAYLNLFRSHEKILELFLILFGSGEYLSNTLVKQPGLVDVLMNLEAIYRYKPPGKISKDLKKNLRGLNSVDAVKNALRRFKQSEEVRIGLRFLIKESDLTGTLEDLSDLAEVYLKCVTELAYEELVKQSGGAAPLPRDLAVFGLGKLGGSELNFGSDLDIVYVFDEPETDDTGFPKEKLMDHYVSWCQWIHKFTAERTEAGIAYELDTDLRPDGSRGTLAHSIKGYQAYFENRARIWERQAMIRLRFIAGSEALGKKFIKQAHAFIYGQKLDYGSLIEISRLRERMEKELAREARRGKNVKLGYGGIVDIEFALQILQLMHGRQNPGLRLTPTLDVLKQMDAYGMLDQKDAEQIRGNYLFLRNLECALRIQSDPSTNHLPKDADSLASLGKLLGYADSDAGGIGPRLMADYDATTKQVRAFYRKLIDKFLRTAL